MEIGFTFENSGMKLVCIAFYSLGKRNVGLFQRKSDGMYITARNTSKEADGSYSWAWGHYSEAIRGNVSIYGLTEYRFGGLTKAPLFY